MTIYIGKDATVYNARNDDTMEKIFLCQPFVGQFLPNVVDSEKFLVSLLIKVRKKQIEENVYTKVLDQIIGWHVSKHVCIGPA